MEAGAQVKQHGLDNDLVDRIRSSDYFMPIWGKLSDLLDAKTFIGRAPEQVSYNNLDIQVFSIKPFLG